MIIDWNANNYYMGINQWSSSVEGATAPGGDVIFTNGTLRNNRAVVFTGGSFAYKENGINTESDTSTALSTRFDDYDYYESDGV